MFKLQYRSKDEQVVQDAEPLLDIVQSDRKEWKDDYESNRALRKRLREDRSDDKSADSRLRKQGLAIKMLPSNSADKLTSSVVRFSTERNSMELKKKTAISSIFSNKRTELLSSLRESGIRCKSGSSGIFGNKANTSSLVISKKRRRSTQSSEGSTSAVEEQLGLESLESQAGPSEPRFTDDDQMPGDLETSTAKTDKVESSSFLENQNGDTSIRMNNSADTTSLVASEMDCSNASSCGILNTSLVAGYSSTDESS